MNSLFYAKSILNVSLANPALSCENQYNIINRRVDNLVNKRKQRQPTKEFYDQLDVFVNLQVKSIDVFNKAVTIAIKQGFNEIEIGAFLQEYLKDKIPKTTLYRYLQKIEVVPVELLDFLTVPVEQTKQQQDARVFKHVEDPEFNRLMDLAYEEMSDSINVRLN
jgi:hypothetical protein